MVRRDRFLVFLSATLFVACSDDDPQDTILDAGDVSSDTSNDASSDAADGDAGTVLESGAFAWEGVQCEPAADAYTPDADDDWPECISDAGDYETIQQNVSTIARVAAFEQIADLLWRNDAPTPEDFIAARDLYATGEGLDSRLQRREDEHYPPVEDDQGNVLSCRDEGVPEMDPNRCVGPALILPVLNDAFQRGIQGESPRIQAARIEAALLWFLHVSVYKESTTCAAVRADCDSSWAYYTGGQQRGEGIGLASYVRAASPEADDRVFDGLLGVRCWRDVEQAEPAEDTSLQALALAQMDRGLNNGLARVLADRLAKLTQPGVDTAAEWAFIQIIGPVLDREATLRDATHAAVLRDAWAEDSPAAVDVVALIEALAELFPCPE